MSEQFISKRTKVSLPDAKLLRRGDEKRHNFSLAINLSEGNTIMGMPSWIQDAYTHLQKSQSRTDASKFNVKLMNMALDFFPTEMTGGAFFSIVAEATLTKFEMVRKGDGDDASVLLNFTAYFPGRRDIHDWVFDHKNADFWVEFEQQQGELKLSDEAITVVNPDGPNDKESTANISTFFGRISEVAGYDESDVSDEDSVKDEDDEALTDPDPANIEKHRRKATSKKFDPPASPTDEQVAKAKKKLAIM